ncbi:hypothetical protein PR002_g30533 [Phytophthora rubi]|uniref:DDE Tnp4 domain-containing protein n=1 Tax=Phytophthora rubi TaxID=129364 RepID=A0A6A3GS79_9STRA|nr:hypothetical protein PR002_g30533 [Phytophthora rubi]
MAKYPDYVIYGDQGYPLRSWIICPYAGAVLTNAQTQFNLDLSKARVAVEWSFGWIVRDWEIFTHPNNMKLFKSPIGLLYIVAAFLTNCLSCVRRRNQTSKYFRCNLPTLEIYLADLHDEDVNEDDYPSDVNEDFFDDESDLSSDSDSSDYESSDTSITSDDENKLAN